MQSFTFVLRHIPGKLNKIADYLSRIHALTSSVSLDLFLMILPSYFDVVERYGSMVDMDMNHLYNFNNNAETSIDTSTANKLDVDDAIRQVHGGRMAHFGVRRTWLELNKHFPGHRIPVRYIQSFIANCSVCQKERLIMSDSIQPTIRHLKPNHHRSVVGVDTLTITPADSFANCYLTVIVNHFTKHSYGYPSSTHDGLQTATALFQYFCTFGLSDVIISDPGTEFTNEAVQHLHKWFGIRHRFSLVDRHESNGVEGTNKQILRHLRALVYDERVKSQWSSPTILPIIFFILNSSDSSETGVVPFHAHFGTEAHTYFKLPENLDALDAPHEFLRLLDTNLQLVRSASKKYQDQLVLERTKSNPAPELRNEYAHGDFVLFQLDPNKPRPDKLHPRFRGPFEVIRQVSNDVECKNIITGMISTFHVERLKPFFGSYDSAFAAAQLDNDQFVIDAILAYRGDPMKRTTMEFETRFMDGSTVWLPYSNDISLTTHFEDYCRSNPPLLELLYDVKTAAKHIRILNSQPITEFELGQVVYVDLRSYAVGNTLWFEETCNLPDWPHIKYVVKSVYRQWANAKHTKVSMYTEVFDETLIWDHYSVRSYGSCPVFDPVRMVLIDPKFVLQYPQVLPDSSRAQLLARYSKTN